MPVDGNADCTTTMERVWRFHGKPNTELLYDPAIPLLSIYPEKKKSCNTKRYIHPMFISALFTIAKTWKQPKCPFSDEWIKKVWSIYTMEYNSAIKKNKITPLATTWMQLEILIVSEVRQK